MRMYGVEAFDAHSAVGRPARANAGLVPAATFGTRSIPEQCAQRVPPVDFNPMPLLYPLVATLRLLCGLTLSEIG